MSKLLKSALVEYGIKDKSDRGDMSKIESGKLYDYVIQKHMARRAGEHNDFRFGNKDLGMFSFATKKELPTEPNQKIKLFQQPVHTHEYKDFEGQIGHGYGAGHVKKQAEGQVLITSVKPNHISFSFADKSTPARYTMVKLQKDKEWLLIRHANPKDTGFEKPKYSVIPKDKIFDRIDKLQEGDVVQPKIDGALTLVQMNKNIEMMSHRISKRTGDPVVHTERFFRKSQPTPKGLEGSFLLGEMYGTKDDKAVHPAELGGILNSNVGKSIETQDAKKIKLKTMLFDILKHKGKPFTGGYQEKLKTLGDIQSQLPQDKFHLPDSAHTKEKAKELLNDIMAKNYPLTTEGIVLHSKGVKPSKLKLTDEHNVFIRDTFPGEGKYEGNGVGGFTYSFEPDGEIKGRVGSGITDELRKDMFNNPDKYIGRTARVKALEKNKAGVLQKPSFIALDESKSQEKTAKEFQPDYTVEELKNKGVYAEVYDRTLPRLASLDKWPDRWMHKDDPGGWLEWYDKYSKGRRHEDDERQIKRWNAFKARHGGPAFASNPTPRRAYALEHWGIDPVKLVPAGKKKFLRAAMQEYKAKKYKDI